MARFRSPPRLSLRGVTWEHPRGYLPLAASAAAWRTKEPFIRVIWDQLEWYAFEREVVRSLGGLAEYDLVMLDHPWIGAFAENGWLLPFSRELQKCLAAQVVAPSLETYVWNDRLWALPVDAACHVCAWRPDLLTGSVPSMWGEVLDSGRQLQRAERTHAFASSFAGVQTFMLFLSMAATFGYRPYERPASKVLPRTEALHILELIAELHGLSHPASIDWSPAQVLEHLRTSDSAAICPSVFGYVNYAAPRGTTGALEWAPPPRAHADSMPRAIVGGVGIAVAANSLHHSEAIRFTEYVMSQAVQAEIFPSNGGQPGLRAAWSDPGVQERTGGFYPAMLDAMRTGYTRPRFPGWMGIELESGAVLNEFLRHKQNPATALDALEMARARACSALF